MGHSQANQIFEGKFNCYVNLLILKTSLSKSWRNKNYQNTDQMSVIKSRTKWQRWPIRAKKKHYREPMITQRKRGKMRAIKFELVLVRFDWLKGWRDYFSSIKELWFKISRLKEINFSSNSRHNQLPFSLLSLILTSDRFMSFKSI